MTKRFFISYSLITLFLLDSVVLFAQCENAFAQQWKIEDASHALQVIERTDTLDTNLMLTRDCQKIDTFTRKIGTYFLCTLHFEI